MSSLWRLMACLVLPAAGPQLHAQIVPGPTNALQFEVSIEPTNNAVLITATTNTISLTVSNWIAFTNISITGLEGTNVIEFLDAGTPPDDTPGDGIFRGLLVTPLVTGRTPLLLSITMTGTNLASVTGEIPSEFPEVITNRLEVTYIIAPRPPNDSFTNALRIASGGSVTFGTNEFASLEPGEPAHGNVATAAASVWWAWSSPDVNGPVFVDLAGTDFPAVLAVYEGNRVSNLVALASSTGDTASGLPPNVTFTARPAATYRIAVAGTDTNHFGNIRLRVAPGATPDTRPPVVTIQSPAPDSIVTSETLLVSGSAREPFPLDSGVSNVLVQVNGEPLTNAVGSASWSAVLTLPPGTNVIRAFAVDYAGNTSAADSIVVRYLNPTNDYFALSAQLPGTGGFVTAPNAQATREPGEPAHAGNEGGRSVWYWWRAPSDGELALTTQGSTADTLLAVYQGSSLADLTEVVSNDEAPGAFGWSALTFFASSNEVYRIVVDSFGAGIGEYALQYVFTPLQAGSFVNLIVQPGVGGIVSPPGGAFPTGARVTLNALPDEDFAFVAWEGDVASTENPLTLVMSQNYRVSARFRTVRFTDDFETADFSRIPWTLGSPPWIVQTNSVAGGRFAARSAPIDHRQSASLLISTNTGAGTGSFDFRVSSEPSWDFLEFLIDGTVVRRWSGEVPWQTVTFNISAGTHTFEWRYTKDPNFSAGLDCAFVDNVYLPPRRDSGGGGDGPELGIQLFSEGAQITLQGQPGVTYEIQTAPDLDGDWSPIATQSSASGIINVLDLEAVGASRRFYRAVAR